VEKLCTKLTRKFERPRRTLTMTIIDLFGPLDEMIQLIYQGIHQFVVMSNTTHDEWTVHIGMVGVAGRWWRGVWREKDVSVVVSYFILKARHKRPLFPKSAIHSRL